MKNYTVSLYRSGDREIWNAFLATAKNATFLFHRDFMEYHNDRFDDFSLLVFDEKKLVALLAANKKDDVVFSHQGLTYGGLIYDESIRLDSVISIFRDLLAFLSERGIAKLQLKSIPSIYHQKPAEETDYALFLAKAKLYRRDTLSVIDMTKKVHFTSSRKFGINKGIKSNLEIREVDDLKPFWNQILIPNLESRYHTLPVHSIAEITLLKSYFPNNIRQFDVYHNNEIVGGTTIFQTDTVAHSQYISANETKRDLGTLDFLYAHLLTNVFQDSHFFDFGTSNEQNGQKLNSGLSFWKSGFGASIICQDFYEVETKNHINLSEVLI